jgi:hypothetical protein
MIYTIPICAIIILCTNIIQNIEGAKLLVIYADGFGGSNYWKYVRAGLPAFETIERNGVWSDMVQGVFPTQQLPSIYSLLTGFIFQITYIFVM